jgi:hypothetical protein
MSERIVCPSGLNGTLRGMKVREERILTDRARARSGGNFDALLAACWEELEDAGPYAFDGDVVDWSKVLTGDRFFALVQLRIATYGADYAFNVNCQEAGCRQVIPWELDLRELPVRPLSDASRKAFLDGNRFPFLLPDSKRTVLFRLLTGADEQKLAQRRKGAAEAAFSGVLAYRIVQIEGVEARDQRRFIEDLALRDADALLDEFDRVDCGVDTTIEIECPHCYARQSIELPFGVGFLLPGRGRTERKRSSPR